MAISNGSTCVLRTEDEIYSPCTIVTINDKNITVKYFVGMKKKGETMYEDHRVKTIPLKNIVHISERL